MTKKIRKILAEFESKFIPTSITSILLLSACTFSGQQTQKTSNSPIEHHDIVIVGAGISGLSCGYFLKNKDFIILEKENTVGGRTISGVKNSFSYAKGTEYLGEPESHLAEMLKGLNLTPKEIPSPMDATFDGKNFYYGSEGIHRYFVKHSSNAEYKKFVQTLLREYKDYEEIPDLNYDSEAKSLDNISATQWFTNNEISEVYQKKYNVASKGLFGANLDEISALSFIPEAAFDYEHSDLEDLSDDDMDVTPEEEYAEALKEHSDSYTFPKGLTEITNKLAKVLGNKIKLNSAVSEITKQGDEYLVVYKDKNGKESKVLAKKLVMAVPAPIAMKIAPKVISKEKADLINQIKFSSYATVALFSKKPIFNKAFDLAVPDDYFFTDIYDATWVQRKYEKSTPTENIISVYIAPQTYKDHSLDTMSDKELISKVYKDLDKVFPGESGKITGYDIHRFPYAYPVMTLGAYERLLKLDKLNEGSLILAGDSMIYPTFESAVESGYLASEKISE